MTSLNNTNLPYTGSILSDQISLLGVLFPGLGPVVSSVLPLLAGTPSIFGRLLCLCGFLLMIVGYVQNYLETFLRTYFISKIEVPYHDEAYDMLILWVCSQPFARSARASLAAVNPKGPRSQINITDNASKKLIQYSPCNGRSYFWHKRRLFVFERNRSQEQFGFTREEATLSYFGRNPNVLKELLDECRQHYIGLVENKICVFEHEGNRWKPAKSRSKRDMSTVVINEQLKQTLLDDVKEFLDYETRSWYSERDLPYQRGYLLYGPPGTGKSSFSISVAGHFDLDLYVLSMSSLNNDSLKALFADLPQHCVVLLEDIDATGLDRTQDKIADAGQNGHLQKFANAKVSLSALLNVLDGIGSPEGRVLIMTTNHIERLDPALIRPGRADIKVEFQLADVNIIRQLFFLVYGSKPTKKIGDDGSVTDGHRSGEKKAAKDCKLDGLAHEFVTKVPKLEFSPAEIMSLLLVNKRSPGSAINGVDAWTERIREERGKKAKTDTWTLDENDGF